MQTLQEFLFYTKTWEYLVSILALVYFVWFWRLLFAERRNGKKEKKEE